VAQLVVRNIEESVKSLLQRRARLNRRSMEEEIRDILRTAAVADAPNSGGLGKEISGLFAKVGLEGDIPELRGHEIQAHKFDL
jgi:antitoxin FitA